MSHHSSYHIQKKCTKNTKVQDFLSYQFTRLIYNAHPPIWEATSKHKCACLWLLFSTLAHQVCIYDGLSKKYNRWPRRWLQRRNRRRVKKPKNKQKHDNSLPLHSCGCGRPEFYVMLSRVTMSLEQLRVAVPYIVLLVRYYSIVCMQSIEWLILILSFARHRFCVKF